MTTLPTGTVTFLFTDIEGSTGRWDAFPDAMRAALERHDALMRAAVEANASQVFKTVGDAFCAAFATAGVRERLPESIALHDWGELLAATADPAIVVLCPPGGGTSTLLR